MPKSRIYQQIITMNREIHTYMSLLCLVPCVYTRNVLINLINDRLNYINSMIYKLDNEAGMSIAGTTVTKGIPDSTYSTQSSTNSSESGIEQLTKGIQPSALYNISSIPPQSTNINQSVFTEEQLSKYDGIDGNPAYVAVNGVIYDVTNNAAWAAATHFGLVAGQDLTQEFASCHAGQNILSKLNAVGRLVK
ncbi:MAG: cytochrome B5 [Clostridia bacterium]|nr:cytochrome B5 [Clostridia bacterium]